MTTETVKTFLWKRFSNTSEYHFDENGCQTHKWEDGAEEFITIPHTCSGDYAGSCIDKSNRIILIDMFNEYQKEYDELQQSGDFSSEEYAHRFEDGKEWNHLSAGYGYEGLCIKANLPIEKVPTEILITIGSLEINCCIDEDKLSEVEQEVISESWEYFAEKDLLHSAENAAVSIVDCEGIAMENALCSWLSIRSFDLYCDYCKIYKENPSVESCESAHFPLLEECGVEIGENFASRIVWC